MGPSSSAFVGWSRPGHGRCLRGALVALCALCACGRIGYDARGGDAGPGVDASVDAAAVAPCRAADAFAAPRPVTELNTAADEAGLRLSADGTGYFTRGLFVGADPVPRIHRASPDEARGGFAAPTLVLGLANVAAEDPAVAADGTALIFASPLSGNYDLWGAARVSGEFVTPRALTVLNTDQVELAPYLLSSGKALYFSRINPGAGVSLLRTKVDGAGGGGVAAPTVASSISVVSNPVVSEDELELFYSVNGDIYRATRASADSLFVSSARIATLSSDGFDAPSWMSPDGCTLYLTSDRPGGAGENDLWVASRR